MAKAAIVSRTNARRKVRVSRALEEPAFPGQIVMKGEKRRSNFVLCIQNDGADDLEPRKVYQVLPDRVAAREGNMRVIDESGEDYLYPAKYFVPVQKARRN